MRLGADFVWLLSFVLLGSAVAVPAGAADRGLAAGAAGLAIQIDGNDGFRAYPGVLSGSGSALDPYVIEGASIDVSTAPGPAGVLLRNTTAHVVLRGLRLYAGSGPTPYLEGVILWNVSNVVVYSVTFEVENNLDILDSRNVTVAGNTFRYGSVVVERSADVAIAVNVFNDARFLTYGSSRVSLVANTLLTRAWVPGVSLSLTGSSNAAVQFYTSSDITAVANSITTTQPTDVYWAGGGIYLRGSTRAVLAGNDIRGGAVGIQAQESGNLTIRANRITRVTLGILVEGSALSGIFVDNLAVSDNLLSDTPEMGLALDDADGLLVQGNEIRNASWGIRLVNAHNGSVLSNLVSGTEIPVLAWGLMANLFSRNTFMNYTLAPEQEQGANNWNDSYPIGGNYWSNYTGPDECSNYAQTWCHGPDGLGDVPFNVTVGAVDWYPYMRPLAMPDRPPVAAAVAYPPVGSLSTTFWIDATASSDPEGLGAGLQARWDFEGDGVWDTFWSPALTVNLTYSTPGAKTVVLELRDAVGHIDRTTTTLVVTEAPTVTTAFAGLPLEVLLPAVAIPLIGVGVAFVFIRRRETVRRRRIEAGRAQVQKDAEAATGRNAP